MIIDFLSPNQGIINQLIAALGFEKTYFLIEPSWFRTIYVSSDIWATVGYEAIIYMVQSQGSARRFTKRPRWMVPKDVT